MKLIRRISISLGILILIAGLGLMLLFNWPRTGFKSLTVATGSMRPALPVGSLVLVHSVPLSSLKVGDIITYTNLNKRGTTITHRIVKTYKIDGQVPAFITKGDANQVADTTVVGGLVRGKTIWHVPKLGHWLNQTKKPYVVLPIVYIPAIFIMVEEVRRLSEYYRRQVTYRIVGYERSIQPKSGSFRLISGLSTTLKIALLITLIFSLAVVPIAHALLKSNQVSLINNRITVAPRTSQCPPGNNSNTTNVNISGSNSNNNVTINDGTNQASTTGNASSSDGGNATSGNASNNSCSNIKVTITNH